MAEGAPGGIISRPSNHSVDETVDRLERILESKGITLVALVDHSGEARKVGLEMPMMPNVAVAEAFATAAAQ